MSRSPEWQKVLDAEVARWSEMSWEQLVTELREVRAYQVELESKRYQVEVQLLENTSTTSMPPLVSMMASYRGPYCP
jgi:ribosomal protein L29